MHIRNVAWVLAAAFLIVGVGAEASGSQSSDLPTVSPGQAQKEYRVLATKKTSTMDEELNEAADAGYRAVGIMGGSTAWGGSEVVVIMERDREDIEEGRYQYRLLATSKTSTMQNELQEAGDAGFTYVGQTVFSSTFGGQEVVIVLEHDRDVEQLNYEYKLLATSKTSTMQDELQEAADAGYVFVGVTVASTTFGGDELVTILRRVVE